MHSRIFQIETTPVLEDAYITEDDFYDHWFTLSVADYVYSDTDRNGEIAALRSRLDNVADFVKTDAFTILPGGKERYFADAYQKFACARDKTLTLGLSDFADGTEFAQAVQVMKDTFSEKYGVYVISDEFDIVEFDKFIRTSSTDTTYYIGAILGYHC